MSISYLGPTKTKVPRTECPRDIRSPDIRSQSQNVPRDKTSHRTKRPTDKTRTVLSLGCFVLGRFVLRRFVLGRFVLRRFVLGRFVCASNVQCTVHITLLYFFLDLKSSKCAKIRLTDNTSVNTGVNEIISKSLQSLWQWLWKTLNHFTVH